MDAYYYCRKGLYPMMYSEDSKAAVYWIVCGWMGRSPMSLEEVRALDEPSLMLWEKLVLKWLS